MSEKPEALRLAERIDLRDYYDFDAALHCPDAAIQLRRLHAENERLREAIEAYIRAKDSDGGGKGGFFPKPPTVAHQRRVHLAWQELNAALRREDV